MYKIALLKILKSKKSLLQSIFFSIFFLILFFYFANFTQVNQAFALNLSFFTKISVFFEIIIENFKVMPIITFILYSIWTLLFFLFNIVFVFLWKQKRDNTSPNLSLAGEGQNIKTDTGSSKIAFVSSVFSFLGFGCIACGQTILLSLITFFFSATANTVYFAGNFILFLGVLLLIYVIKKDLKQIYLDKMCEI
jgi:hypothetical protein